MRPTEIPIQRLVGICSALFIISVATTPPAQNFQPSIFEDLSTISLFLGITLIVTGVSLLTVSVACRVNYLWPGIVAIGTTYLGLYLIPVIKQYRYYGSFGADQWVHFGRINDVLKEGSLPDTRYPATHLISSELSLVTGQHPDVFNWFLPLFFFIITVVSTVTFAWSLTRNQRLSVCVILAAILIIISPHRALTQPWVFSLAFLPILLLTTYYFDETRQYRWSILTVTLIVGTLLYHPLSLINGILLLIVYGTVRYSESYHNFWPTRGARTTAAFSFSFLGGIILTVWILFRGIIDGHIERMFLRILFGESGGGQHIEESVRGAKYTVEQVFWYFILPEVGAALAVFVMSGFAALVVAVHAFQRRRTTLYDAISLVLFVFAGLHATSHLAIQIYGSGIERNTHLLAVVAPFVLGSALYYVFIHIENRDRAKQLVIVAGTIMVFSGVVILGAATLYDSGGHKTHATVDGHSWFLQHSTTNDKVVSDVGRDRFGYTHFGYSEFRSTDFDHSYSRHHPVPHRFGYDNTTIDPVTMSNDSTYILTRQMDLEIYDNEPEFRLDAIIYYTEADLEELDRDNGAIRIFDNNGYVVWRVE